MRHTLQHINQDINMKMKATITEVRSKAQEEVMMVIMVVGEMAGIQRIIRSDGTSY
jgi:hypothetical protein